ncbi:MAG TPA: UTP--glucose-1-phosphate uridylyltransferase [Planctomycetes bacterium]|nr:UTP--glucose-1-phosphate uridylyltransferase [Planctomycetota bacterium]
MISKAVIPAAGFGTRFLPATKSQPKEMLPVIDKPVIQYVVEEAVASGITDVLIITGRGKQAIENHFDRAVELEIELEAAGKDRQLHELRKLATMADVHYIRQGELRGLGAAVHLARRHVGDEPFVVLLGDTIVDPENGVPATRLLVDAYNALKKAVVGLEVIDRGRSSHYGMAEPAAPADENGNIPLKSAVEKPYPVRSPSELALVGRYVFEPSIFPLLENELNAGPGAVDLTAAINSLIQNAGVYGKIVHGRRYDIGERMDYVEAVLRLGLQRDDLAPEIRQLILALAAELDSSA